MHVSKCTSYLTLTTLGYSELMGGFQLSEYPLLSEIILDYLS